MELDLAIKGNKDLGQFPATHLLTQCGTYLLNTSSQNHQANSTEAILKYILLRDLAGKRNDNH